MSNFSVHSRAAGPVQVLALEGELDAHTASELEAAFERCQAESQYRVVVNGADLDYISSAGLGVFMAFVEEMREQGGDIKVAALQPKVYNVFDLLGFPMLFDIEDTEAEACARFEDNGDAESRNAEGSNAEGSNAEGSNAEGSNAEGSNAEGSDAAHSAPARAESAAPSQKNAL